MSVHNNSSIGSGYSMLPEPLACLRDIVTVLETKLNDEAHAKDKDILQQKGYTSLSRFFKAHEGTKLFIQGLIDKGLYSFLLANYDLLLGHISKLTKDEIKKIIGSLPEDVRREDLKESLELAVSSANPSSQNADPINQLEKDRRNLDAWKRSQERTVEFIIGLLPPDQKEEQRRQLDYFKKYRELEVNAHRQLTAAFQIMNMPPEAIRIFDRRDTAVIGNESRGEEEFPVEGSSEPEGSADDLALNLNNLSI